MGNAFGIGGWAWLGVGGPVGKGARLASSAKATVGSAKNLGSATTPFEKLTRAWQTQHNASFLLRNLKGSTSKKPTQNQTKSYNSNP